MKAKRTSRGLNMNDLNEPQVELHLLFSSYLAHKIKEGVFPKGSKLPSGTAFMMVFKLKFSDILKALLDLEERGLIQIIGNAEARVVEGKTGAKAMPFDVRKDISGLFEQIEKLQHKAVDNAWPRINKEAMRSLFLRDKDMQPSERVWRMNRVLQRQVVGNCGDMQTCLQLENLHEHLEFFRQLYLDSIPEDEILIHSLAIESIVQAFVVCDLKDVHEQISAYLAQIPA